MHKRMELFALLVLIGLIIAVSAVSYKEDDQAQQGKNQVMHSSYRTMPGGYKALYLTLDKLGYPVYRQLRPLGLLQQHGLLVIADPYTTPTTPYEGRKLTAWLRKGNYALCLLEQHPAVLTGFTQQPGDTATEHLPESETQPSWWETPEDQPAEITVARPAAANTLLSHPVPLHVKTSLRLPVDKLPRWDPESQQMWVPLYQDAKGVVAAYAPVGKGGIILCSSPWSFSNEGIDTGENLDLLLALAEKRPGGAIIFDEYHHGYGTGMTVWNLAPNLMKLGLLQIGLAMLLLLITLSWRFGPPRLPVEERFTRTRAEYLSSMAALLQRARATHIVCERLQARVRRELGRRLGVPSDAGTEQFLHANAALRVVDPQGLAAVLQQLDQLTRQAHPDQEALVRLSREIHRVLHDR